MGFAYPYHWRLFFSAWHLGQTSLSWEFLRVVLYGRRLEWCMIVDMFCRLGVGFLQYIGIAIYSLQWTLGYGVCLSSACRWVIFGW